MSHIDRRGGSDAGFGLIEVIVSAAVMLMISAGALSLINGTQRTQTQNRDRTVAADLAEQDQERLRSTRVLDLSNLTQVRTVSVGGIPYTVTSKSTWLRDSSGAEVTCTNSSGQAEYMRITSTVVPAKTGAGQRPVTLSSLVAPDVGTYGPGQGTLAVQIKDRSGAGMPSVPVTVTGPQTGTVATDSNGCAVFNYYSVGSYDIAFSKPGYVNVQGKTDVTIQGQPINAGVVTQTTDILYDRPAAIDIRVETKSSTSGTATQNRIATKLKVPVNSPQDAVTVGNSGIGNASNGFFFTGPYDAEFRLQANNLVASNLFPFVDGDTVYSGRTASNDPSTAGGGATYYSTNPGQVALTPGATSSVTIFQPWLNVKIKRTSGSSTVPVQNAIVFAKESGGAIYKIPGATDAQGSIGESLPWGKYQLCATDGTFMIKAPTSNTPSGFVALGSFSPTNFADITLPAASATTNKGTCTVGGVVSF